jgi:hypothetical protein
MRKAALGVLLGLLFLAWPALAQEQRGSIEGVVKDNTGAVLTGATVDARSSTGAIVTTVTDASGAYRFPALPIGTYDVEASLQGFTTAKVAQVSIRLGEIKTVTFSLNVSGVAESVQVSGESPLIDIKQSTKATNIRAEQIELLPHDRDFTSVITQAGGVNLEPKFANGGMMGGANVYTGVSIDGASAAENRYVIDGMETTDIIHGQNGKDLLSDFVEEVQIKSSGYEAEYGGSTGGVVNVVTKSGSDLFHGSGSFQWQGSSLTAANNQSLRLRLDDSSQAEYITYPKDGGYRFDPGFSLGGPILKSRMWFFAGYQPSVAQIERTVTPASSGNPDQTVTFNHTQKRDTQNLVASQNAQFSSKLSTRVAFNNSWNKIDGLLPTRDGTDSPLTDYTKGSKLPNWSLSGRADYVASRSLLLSARVGYFRTDQHDYNVPNEPRYRFPNTTNIGMAGVPASLQHPIGYTSIQSNNAVTQDTVTRTFIQADATWFFHAGGDHSLKGGVQVDRRAEDIVSGELQNRVSLFWDIPLNLQSVGYRGPFGYYSVRSNAVLPKQGFITQGDVRSNLAGLFIQDSWTVNNKLTVNAGLRTENENVPAFDNGETNHLGANPIDFGMADKIAPRAGFAYDLKGNGRSKIYGSWGMFYDIFKLELPQGSFGGQKWIEYYYTLDTPEYTSLIQGANCPPACPGTLITSTNFRLPSLNQGDVQSNLKPMRSQEVAIGFDQQINNLMAFGVRYVHKQIDRAIEDTGAIDEDNNEPFVIANPGEGFTETFNLGTFGAAYAGSSGKYANPKPKRVYNAVEFSVEKRLSSGWFLRSVYTVSRLHGNYPGLAQSDENGRSDPNVGRLFDYPLESFDGNGRPLDGVLPTDRTNYLKLSGAYQFKFGTTVGLNQMLASGLPIGPSVSVIDPHGYPLYYLGRDGAGRTPALSQTDLVVMHDVRMGGGRRLQLSLNVLNLFNQRTTIDRFANLLNNGSINFDQAAFLAGQVNIPATISQQVADGLVTRDPRYLQGSAFQNPRLARVAIRFLF